MTLQSCRSTIFAAIPLGCMLVTSGCQALEQSGFIPEALLVNGDEMARKEREHRLQYIEKGDPDALRWLLGHRIETGMTLAEVNKVFGQEGVEETDDGWIKKHNSRYRRSDNTYGWGPDSRGESIYLVFRNEQLVNFDPAEFR